MNIKINLQTIGNMCLITGLGILAYQSIKKDIQANNKYDPDQATDKPFDTEVSRLVNKAGTVQDYTDQDRHFH